MPQQLSCKLNALHRIVAEYTRCGQGNCGAHAQFPAVTTTLRTPFTPNVPCLPNMICVPQWLTYEGLSSAWVPLRSLSGI